MTVYDRALASTTNRRAINLECSGECPPQPDCECGIHGDVLPIGPEGVGDGYIDVLDVVAVVRAVFGGGCTPQRFRGCSRSGGDLVPDGFLDVLDIVEIVNIAFRNKVESADPCGEQ